MQMKARVPLQPGDHIGILESHTRRLLSLIIDRLLPEGPVGAGAPASTTRSNAAEAARSRHAVLVGCRKYKYCDFVHAKASMVTSTAPEYSYVGLQDRVALFR